MAHHGLVLALQPGTMLCNGRYKIERELNRECMERAALCPAAPQIPPLHQGVQLNQQLAACALPAGGGTAVVYAADDLSTGGRVALKVPNMQCLAGARMGQDALQGLTSAPLLPAGDEWTWAGAREGRRTC